MPKLGEHSFDHRLARRLRADGWSLRQIAEYFGTDEGYASTICRGVKCPISHHDGGQKHSPETIASVVEMHGVLSAADIARHHGFASRNVVIGIWNRHRR